MLTLAEAKLVRPSVAFALILACVGLVPVRVADAAPIYLTTVRVVCDTLEDTTRSGPIPADSLSCSAGFGSASGVVNSGVGYIRGRATSELTLASNPSSTLFVKGQAVSRFQDSFVVSAQDAGGADIASGFLTAEVHVDTEAVLGGDSGFGSVLWNFTVGSESRNGRALATLPFGNPSSTSGGEFDLQIPWTAGSPIGITFFANAEASTGANSAGDRTALADFFNTMEWRGITSVTDAGGTPVAEFTALNDQGFSYAEAVPEPSSSLLLLIGLPLLWLICPGRTIRRT